MPSPDELIVAESAGPSPREGWLALPPAVEERIEALAAKLDAAWRDVPEGQLWEPDAALQREMDYLGRVTRDTLAHTQKQVRLDRRQGPNRRPARRESRQRRNVRTRRAKARAPSGDPPEPPRSAGSTYVAPARCRARGRNRPSDPLDLVDLAVLSLGWGRV